jgi:hypothetical protein
LISSMLFWRIGLYFKCCGIISAYNHGKPQLEWNPQPKLWSDLLRGYVQRNRSLSLGEMKGFIRVLLYVLE